MGVISERIPSADERTLFIRGTFARRRVLCKGNSSAVWLAGIQRVAAGWRRAAQERALAGDKRCDGAEREPGASLPVQAAKQRAGGTEPQGGQESSEGRLRPMAQEQGPKAAELAASPPSAGARSSCRTAPGRRPGQASGPASPIIGQLAVRRRHPESAPPSYPKATPKP